MAQPATAPRAFPRAPGPLSISGQNGTIIDGMQITSTTGDCVTLSNSMNVTIRNSEIGPCAGNGIVVTGSSTVSITDNYVHPEFTATGCCDTGDGILIESGSSGVLVQGNVVVYGESNIEVPTTASEIHVVGNFLLNPRGPFPRGQQVQAWHVTDVWVENNYGLSSTSGTYKYPENQEDAFNFGYTSGTVIAQNNYITGGHSASGCGLIADEAANGCQFLGNSLLNTGQCGIGIASGTSNVVDSNRVLNTTPVQGAGNTGIYVWSQYSDACGPTTVTNNIACELKTDGTQSGYWNGGGCDPVTETNDIWDTQAQTMLSPPAQKMPPPSIPPLPYACVAPSPF
jgi:Right handed beta helix region